LVRQLLAISRKAEVKLDPVQVNSVVEKVETLFKQTFQKTISISSNLDPNLPPIMADENQLSQVLFNLGLNAQDAMPTGGKLTITTSIVAASELRQVFSSVTEDQYVLIAVSDTGDGINPITKGHIFDPFFTTKTQGKGTGLGLSVVYGIAANHRGFVDVRSDPGEGASFLVYLPVSDNPIDDLAEQSMTVEKTIGGGDTILFVEDEEYQLQLMRRFLEHRGYKVLTAVDGETAVEIFIRHQQEIGLVVLDLGLPKLNGWEAYQRMKQVSPGLKAILATGLIRDSMEVQTTEFCSVIMKPYTPKDVLVEILRVLNGSC
jgi:CheY-like chemotaxis protein